MTSRRVLRKMEREIARRAARHALTISSPAPASAKVKLRNGSLIDRICVAVDRTPEELSVATGLPIEDIASLDGTPRYMGFIDDAATWQAVYEYVSTRLGLMLAAREELQRQLSKDNRRRLEERLRVEQR